MRRGLAAAGVAALALLASQPAPASSETGRGAATAEAKPRLHRCDLGPPRPFRCGRISVPLFRGRPAAGRTRIGFAVRPRSNRRRPSLGTIVAVEGGPGYAATAGPFASSMLAVLAPLLRRRELVLVDARGTGRSGVLNCPGLQRGSVPEPVGVARCARQLGARFAAYTTAATVRDLEAGELDDVTSVAEARQVARRFPRSQLFVDPNRGHASSLYYPFVSPAVDVIRAFIRRR